ncbi:MAG: MBL fold metallo-hydrolase [Chloroflexi bacterium]|nr:MBL fold metallo-hydrolase [Chloroflexota bacterium]
MELTYFGLSCFRLKGQDVTVVADPYGPESGTLEGLSADIVTSSGQHPEHGNLQAVRAARRVLQGPGEYEIRGVFILGIQTGRGSSNTAYVIEMDGVTLCHLGALTQIPTAAQIEQLGGADVLLLPVGGGGTLEPTTAVEAVSLLAPKIIVPMHFRTDALGAHLQPVDRFLREMGVPEAEAQPRLAVTPTSLPTETRVVVLQARKS